jgi:hypothetical protein
MNDFIEKYVSADTDKSIDANGCIVTVSFSADENAEAMGNVISMLTTSFSKSSLYKDETFTPLH